MDTNTHECVATHCVACCPTAKGYSEGYGDAKALYGTLSMDDKARVMAVAMLIAVIAICILFVLVREARRERNSRMD